MPLALKERPIFVIGAERSGTTLLMAMLGCHPRIAVPEVAWFYPRFRPYLYTYGALTEKDNMQVLLEEMIFGLKTPFWEMDVNPRTIVDELQALAKEPSFAGAYDAILTRFAQESGKPRWGEKTPYNLFYIKEILEDFPNAQFVFITRDGRDASADYLASGFGPTNIYCAGEIWRMCQEAVEPWRAKLPTDQWMDVCYEDLVKDSETMLKAVCTFLGEDYHPNMLNFHQTDIAKARGATRDHAPLGQPVTTQFIGIYKNQLSKKEQSIFMAAAGKALQDAGYEADCEPAKLTAEEIALFWELDGRIRAATLDAPHGHIVFESYNDWLVDQRDVRLRKGEVLDMPVPAPFPIGHVLEDYLAGLRAMRKWKTYLCIKRQYYSAEVVL